MVMQRQAINIGALQGQQEGWRQSREDWRHRERSLLSPVSFLGGGTPRNGDHHRCLGHQGGVLVRRVRLVVSRPTASPIAHTFDVIQQAAVK